MLKTQRPWVVLASWTWSSTQSGHQKLKDSELWPAKMLCKYRNEKNENMSQQRKKNAGKILGHADMPFTSRLSSRNHMQSWRRSWDKKLTGVFTAWAEDSDQVISPTFKNDHMRIPQKPTSIKAAMARSIWKVPLQCRSQPVLKQWSYALYYITKTSSFMWDHCSRRSRMSIHVSGGKAIGSKNTNINSCAMQTLQHNVTKL